MKKLTVFFIILFVVVLVSCWNESRSGLRGESSGALSRIVIPENEDAGLFLYRIPRTAKLIVDFYSDIAGSEDIAMPIIKYSDKYDIPLSLSFALVWMESRFNPKAINRNAHSIDRGLFQLNSKSFSFLKTEDFYDPSINAKYGTAHLKFCLDRGKNEVVALAIYNAGTVGVRKGTPVSTLRYISRILEYRDTLERRFESMVLNERNIVLARAEDLARANRLASTEGIRRKKDTVIINRKDGS